jgi:thermostable 8-oxoguanine DNA glycosylase
MLSQVDSKRGIWRLVCTLAVDLQKEQAIRRHDSERWHGHLIRVDPTPHHFGGADLVLPVSELWRKTMQPLEVTNYERTDEELERFWIFCIIVAGKNSDWASSTVGKLLNRKPDGMLPMEFLKSQGNALHNTLVANRVGQYGRISKAIQQSYALDLRSCSVADLESIHGVGPKTARFFLLHSREDVKCAVIDTHVLKYLRQKNAGISIPDATPQSKAKYQQMESLFLAMISNDFPELTVAAADLLIWAYYSGRLDNDVKFADDIFGSDDAERLQLEYDECCDLGHGQENDDDIW